MTYRQRLSLFIFIDSCIVLIAVFFSSFLVDATLNVITVQMVIMAIALLISHHFFAFRLHLYKKAWEYASVGELLTIFKVVSSSIVIAAILQEVLIQEVFVRLLLVTWLLHILMLGGSRFCWRVYRDSYINSSKDMKKTLIVGAGAAGTMVARQLMKNKESGLFPIGFIDDDETKHQLEIMGLPVFGGVNHIVSIVRKRDVDNIIIAIPSLSKRELNIIFQECAKTDSKTQILPMLEDLVTGKVSVNQFRDV